MREVGRVSEVVAASPSPKPESRVAVVRSGVPGPLTSPSGPVDPRSSSMDSMCSSRHAAAALVDGRRRGPDQWCVWSGFFWHEWNVAVPRHLASKFGQSERSARESRGTLDENLRREEHCEHAEKRDDEHLQQSGK